MVPAVSSVFEASGLFSSGRLDLAASEEMFDEVVACEEESVRFSGVLDASAFSAFEVYSTEFFAGFEEAVDSCAGNAFSVEAVAVLEEALVEDPDCESVEVDSSTGLFSV